MSTVTVLESRVMSVLLSNRFRWTSEYDLQDSIGELLVPLGEFEREARLSVRDRIDFLSRGGLGIEVKVGASPAATERQLCRYLKSDRVRSLMLVTAVARHQLIRLDGARVVWIGGTL